MIKTATVRIAFYRCLLGLFLPLFLAGCGKTADPEAAHKLAVAQNMVEAWNTRNWDEVYALFTEDGVLHSMMIDPVVGRDAIRERLSTMTPGIEQIELQIANMGVVNDVVMIERVDDFIYNGNPGRVPVVGVMEIEGDQVKIWREYYDHASLRSAMDPKGEQGHVDESASVHLLALTEKLATDWNGGDMDAYLDAYWDDAGLSVMFGNTAVRGRSAMNELFRGNWSTEEAMGDFETMDVNVQQMDESMAVVSGRFQHRFPTETIDGAFSHVWRRFEDDRWLIVHEHTSRGLD